MATRPSPGLPKLSRRARILLITAVSLLLVLIIGSRLLGTYVDWLWYGEVGYRSVFSTVLVTRIVLFFAVGAVIGGTLAVSLAIAYRTRPVFVPVSNVEDPLARYRQFISEHPKLFGIGIPVVAGLISAATGQAQWQIVQLFLHGGQFGMTDPQFGNDIGFYAFTLPFIVWIKNWIFIAIALCFFGALVAHYIFGGLRLAGKGGQLSSAARMQLAILAGLFVLMKAFAYFFDRYELLYSDRNAKFTGASYTDLHAVLPAKLILLCIAVFCAIAFFAGAFLRNLQLPAIATVLMLVSSIVVGAVWPLIMEQFSVKANAAEKEAQPIAHNIEATRQAYGITNDRIDMRDYDPGSARPTTDEVKSDEGTLNNVRLLDPNILSPTWKQLQQGRAFYGFTPKLNIDRYKVDGVTQDYIVGARELNADGLPETQRDWINQHLVYTHGNGLVAAPANDVNPAAQDAGGQGGYPKFKVSDLSNSGDGGLRVDQPRIYYGPLNNEYSVVGSTGDKPREYDTDSTRYTYQGKGGVSLSSFFNKLVFAAYYGERNFLFSNDIGDQSKIIYKRDPAERVRSVAPWLTVDGDPYPAAVNGRIKWIVDGYTTLENYTYAQQTELSNATSDSRSADEPGTSRQAERHISYIRNSVKATVDAYDGSVDLYEVDKKDPVLKAWEGVFPGSVKPESSIPQDLRAHFRYPEDLFKVQRDLLTRYHVSDANQFYSSQTFWDVPSDPTLKAGTAPSPSNDSFSQSASDTSAPKQPPYYVLAQAPGQNKPTFQLTSSLTPLERENLASWVSVSSDPDTYGKFTILTLPTNSQTQGPGQVQNQFDSTDKVTENRTLFNNPAVDAEFGNLLTLPVAGKLLYVEPIYIQRNDENAFPQLARVLVEFNGNVGFATTFDEALDQALTGNSGSTAPPPDNGGSSSSSSSSAPPSEGNAGGGGGGGGGGNSASLTDAVADIRTALEQLRQAQQSGNFEDIGKAYDDLEDATARFEQAQQAGGGGSNGGG